MGHIRLHRLPASRKWQQVVALLAGDADSGTIAGASADAAENSLSRARDDPALAHSFWLLTQIPLAARSADFTLGLRSLGLAVGDEPSLMDVVGTFSDAVDRFASRQPGRTDLGDLAQLAAAESLTAVVGAALPRLFGPTAADVRLAIGKMAAADQFAKLARDFFARLTRGHLDYYLSRTLSDHVGPGRRLASIDEHTGFNAAIEQHCREASRIVESFAGGWFSKTQFEGGITPEKARAFVFVALKKIGNELRLRRSRDA